MKPLIIVMADAEAVYVYALVITSSPKPTPSSRNAHSSAAVAEPSAATRGAPMKAARSRSNCFVFGPVVIHPLFSVSTTSSISAWVISGGEKAIRR